jgi:exonuclease-1
VEYYVAPYEADAQLAYLYLTKRVHAVITEDSDLLIFGVKRVLFKMDKAGNGTEVDLERLTEVEELNFKHFTDDMLLVCCIVSGCDYLDSIKGIGFKKAHKLVMECGDDIQRILKLVRREGKLTVPLGYEKDFEKALLTFKFQLVFSPTERKLVHLHDPAKHPLGKLLKNYVSLDFLGKPMADDVA